MTITLQQHATSPLRSSPLSKPPWPPTKQSKRLSAGSIPPRSPEAGGRPIPRRAPPSPPAPLISTSPTTPSAASASAASAASASPLSRSHPLLGSYHLSLLHSRMSAHAPHSVPSFSLRLKAVATPKCPSTTPAAVKCPPPLDLPFKATYYDLADGVNTPWVADVDLEAWFMSAYGGERAVSSSPSRTALQPSPISAPSSPSSPSETLASPLPPPPLYPGYRVPPVGQLQILVRTPTAAVKVFVIPYDLRSLPVGARLLARERTYVSSSTYESTAPSSGSTPSPASSPQKARETLRYAVQLQFTCTTAPADEVAADPTVKAFYVARTIKLVFSSRAPESSDSVRDERADEVVPPASAPDPHEDWAAVRDRYLASTATKKKKSTRPRPPAAVRGFSPSRERPSTPVAMASPRSLLSALDPRDDDRSERSISPAPTDHSASLGAAVASALLAPTPHPAESAVTGNSIGALARAASPRPPSVLSERRRRGSGVERELSERLRTLELRHRRE